MGKYFKKLHIPVWLFILLAAVLILRTPSLFEPYSYGDEMIYMTLGNGIRAGKVLYKDIHDNKPPLLYFTAAIAGNLFWFKAILMLWSILTVFFFWKLTLYLIPKRKETQKAATAVFAILTSIPLFEGNIANAENFYLGFTILGFLILFWEKGRFYTYLAGLVFATGALFKIPSVFDLGAIVLLWFIYLKHTKQDVYAFIKDMVVLAAGVITPILFTFIWYQSRGALGDYIRAAFLQNFGYLSSWRPTDTQKPFLVKNGPLLLRSMIVLLTTAILWWKKKKLNKAFVFVCLWLVCSLFAVTLSERPYPHYFLQAVPAVAILIGYLLTDQTKLQSLAIIPLTLAFLVPVYFKFYHYDTFSYYERFLKFASHQYTREEYFAHFDGNVNRNYQIAQFILSSSDNNSSLFVWGDSPPIYALTRRFPPIKYVANYHINDFASPVEVIKALDANKPKMIVLLPEGGRFDELSRFVTLHYLPVLTTNEATVYTLTSN